MTKISDKNRDRGKSIRSAMVIGVGNPHRGDDGAGILVARRLRDEAKGRLAIYECDGEASKLMELWRDRDFVVVVDAVRSGSDPGKIHRLEAGQRLPTEVAPGASTHGFGLAQAVEMSRVLGCLPRRLMILGIEGRSMGVGEPMSEAVGRALEQTVRVLLHEIDRHHRASGS